MKIYEVIVTTINTDGTPHIRPMGIWHNGNQWVVAPFTPSRTYDNLCRNRSLVVNMVDDVRIFAGCLTGRTTWPVTAAQQIEGLRLQKANTHLELLLGYMEQDPIRPRFFCDLVYQQQHAPFKGFNRAAAAILEATILISRLDRLPIEEVVSDISRLQIMVDKTAGNSEQQAWHWLRQYIDKHQRAKR